MNEVLAILVGAVVIGGLAVAAALLKPQRSPVDHTTARTVSGSDDPMPQIGGSRTFRLGVAGESYDNADGTSRQRIIRMCSAGEPMQLVPEPENPHDNRAVKVCRQSGEQVGYLPSGHGLFKKVKDGRVSVVVDGIHGGTREKPSSGLVLAITVRG